MKLENVTSQTLGGARRRYDDACGTALALDLVGERWALLVMRELMLGPKRFGQLRADLPGISANTLTQRLEGLEATGLVRRERLPPPASGQVYALTEWGLEAEPIVRALGRWAVRSPLHDPTLPISATSLMLSLRTMFDPASAGDFRTTLGFVIGEESFAGEIANGHFDVARGDAKGRGFVLRGPPPAIAAAIYGGQSFAALEADGALVLEGDRAAAQRFTTFFPLPEKIAPPA